jgi:phosphatidylserine/phosphatidylglycerophosphate/cardiolipin synthase-like enzyme
MTLFELRNRLQYFQELTAEITKAQRGDRVALVAMTVDLAVPSVRTLADTLLAAAERGVIVQFSFDAMTLMHGNGIMPGPLWYDPALEQKAASRDSEYVAYIVALQKAGAKACITNIPTKRGTLVTAGRSHIKAAVINDTVYIGGHNLERPLDIDVMVRLHNKKLADEVFGITGEIITAKSTQAAFGGTDREVAIGNDMTFLLDSGKPNQSLIYDSALAMVDAAEDWIFLTCQFFPGGETARRLKAAQARGVQIDIVYNHPRAHDKLMLAHHLYNIRERSRLPKEFFAQQLEGTGGLRLHAKVLATDKGAMVGSHNYVSQGVRFGTAEVALRSSDVTLSCQLRDFIRSESHIADKQRAIVF